MPTDFTTINHYVQQWYQQRFIPLGQADRRYQYLDLKPDKVIHPNGGFHIRRDRRFLGPISCFHEPHLYTLFFGDRYATDEIEKTFFGRIDNDGASGVEFFQQYEWTKEGGQHAWQKLINFVGAQMLRTPKGLDLIKTTSAKDSHQNALIRMRRFFQMFVTMWIEGCWEVLHCDDSPTKFIVTDHPVVTYNKGLFPFSQACTYPFDAPIQALGTHTIFPLGFNRCLVLTNLGYVRDPAVNPLKMRQNPRTYAPTMFDVRRVQTGRQISEQEVRAINFIMKSRARRYIAAAEKDWLYPEKHLHSTMWNKLGDQYFLMPDPRKMSFTVDTIVGYKDGSAWGADEYGRNPTREKRDAEVKKLPDYEFKTFDKHKDRWDAKFGELTREERRKHWM